MAPLELLYGRFACAPPFNTGTLRSGSSRDRPMIARAVVGCKPLLAGVFPFDEFAPLVIGSACESEHFSVFRTVAVRVNGVESFMALLFCPANGLPLSRERRPPAFRFGYPPLRRSSVAAAG
jgi:hypothetical protein